MEDVDGFDHAVLTRIFEEDLVVFGQSRDENDCSYVIETVDPLATLVPLATHVVDVEDVVVHEELGGHDADGSHSAEDYIIFSGRVVLGTDDIQSLEVPWTAATDGMDRGREFYRLGWREGRKKKRRREEMALKITDPEFFDHGTGPGALRAQIALRGENAERRSGK